MADLNRKSGPNVQGQVKRVVRIPVWRWIGGYHYAPDAKFRGGLTAALTLQAAG